MAAERVVIEVEGDDVRSVAPQIPRAETLEPGTQITVLAGKSRGWLGKVLPPRKAPPSSVIGSALLARGYVGIAAAEERGRVALRGEAEASPTSRPLATGPSEAPR